MQSRQSAPVPGSKFGKGSPHDGQTGGRILRERACSRHAGHTLQSLRRETGVPQTRQLSGNSRFKKGSINRSGPIVEKSKVATIDRLGREAGISIPVRVMASGPAIPFL